VAADSDSFNDMDSEAVCHVTADLDDNDDMENDVA
jgi:hypothetical protein